MARLPGAEVGCRTNLSMKLVVVGLANLPKVALTAIAEVADFRCTVNKPLPRLDMRFGDLFERHDPATGTIYCSASRYSELRIIDY